MMFSVDFVDFYWVFIHSTQWSPVQCFLKEGLGQSWGGEGRQKGEAGAGGGGQVSHTWGTSQVMQQSPSHGRRSLCLGT